MEGIIRLPRYRATEHRHATEGPILHIQGRWNEYEMLRGLQTPRSNHLVAVSNHECKWETCCAHHLCVRRDCPCRVDLECGYSV
ncbi:hypothetical protein PUNSTDRAFT_53523, partial [Punctularia strigosozonata HHB-11173 SS5]|uniref:uncharacterized protein n=1 Tax=Punctularia strigosozonata (strain HHB-11173) TaxID=741275 RepID=UPI00044174C1